MPDTEAKPTASTPNPQPSAPPESKPPVKPTVAVAAQTPKLSKTGDFVTVTAVEHAMNGCNFEGACKVCGWKTLQPVKVLAYDATIAHVRGRHNIE